MSLESQPRLRVLLVDDEQKLTDLLRLELDVEGYDVDVASDGASGLIRSRSEPAPDLIILDWNLPDFSGIDICQRCLLYTSPSPRDRQKSRMPSSA